MSLIAKRMEKLRPSPTIAVAELARKLKGQGRDIISLSTGEPDFDTDPRIKAYAKQAIDNGQTKYTPVAGTTEAKQAVIAKLKRDNCGDYLDSEVMLSTGGKQVLFNAFMATLDAGDEVIIPAPYWVSYPDMVRIAEGVPVVVECDASDRFRLTPAKLEAAITPKTKWLLLNSPSNPSGIVYSEDELGALLAVVRRHKHVHIMSDEIYEHVIYDGLKCPQILALAPDLRERLLLVNGVSKAYAMTGWRIGFAAGPESLIKAMTKLQSQSTSGACSIAQAAAADALVGDQSHVIANNAIFKERRDMVLSKLSQIEGLECVKPEGAFYLFPSCKGLLGRKTPAGIEIKDSADFASYLLEEVGVAVVPGFAFGLEGYFRLSYAASNDLLLAACEKIKIACSKLIKS